MQLANHGLQNAFAAQIARRMLSQDHHNSGRDLSETDLNSLRTRAQALAPGFDLTAQSVAEQLGYQQVMAAGSIERIWPEDAEMQLVARETAAKAPLGNADGQADEDDESSGYAPRG